MFAEAPQVKDTGFLETLSLKGELVFVLSHLNFGSPLKLPCCGSSQSCAARVVFWVGHEKLHESETKKKKRKRVHDELFFGDGCQAAHGDSHLLNGARPLPGSLAWGQAVHRPFC